MNVIIYSTDFEPITVVDLPQSVLDSIEKKGGVTLSLGPTHDELGEPLKPPMCTIHCAAIKWPDGTHKTILLTKNEEVALMLKPDWLPGQRGTYNLYYNHIKELTNRLIKLTRDQ